MREFLNVGCGSETAPPQGFENWKQVRLDIDPRVNPDIVADILDMPFDDGAVEAIVSNHNIEHFAAHDVLNALREMRRVLRDDGFVVISCPDLQTVAERIARGELLNTLYDSESGPIAPLDVVYGLRSALNAGHEHMAHRCGFTAEALRDALAVCGFGAVLAIRRPRSFDLWALAFKSPTGMAMVYEVAERHLPIMFADHKASNES